MPTNVEIKARVKELSRLRCSVMRIANGPCESLQQEDIFYQAQKGRLKLRILSNSSGELIHYERPDTSEAKESNYQIYETSKPHDLRQLLAAALGETVTVKKEREVYLVGPTRIHLDKVDKLGTFIELEVVLSPDQTPSEGRSIASELITKLGIQEADLVSCSYADLLIRKGCIGKGAEL